MCVCVCVFLVKTSYFIAINVPLTPKTIDRFRLVKPISQPVSADS